MLPRSLCHLLLGLSITFAQQQFQQLYQPNQVPQQLWQPQYDPSQQQFAPQQQFVQAQPQFPPLQQQFQAPPLQFQQNQPAQFNQPPIYQPQFQPVQQQQFQQQFQQQSFVPQQQNFVAQQPIQQQFISQQQSQPVFQSVNQSPKQQFQRQQPVFQQQPQFNNQPVVFEQTVKIPYKPVQRPPPPPVVRIDSIRQPQIVQIAAPPPPEKFVPYIADVFSGGSDTKPPIITVINPDSNLPPGTYIAEEIVVDGNHPSFIENIDKFRPRTTIVNVPPRQLQPRPVVVPQPQARLKAPELPPTPQQRPRPPPPQPRPQQPPPLPQPKPTQPKKTTPSSSVSLSGAKTTADVFLGCCKQRNVAKPCERICNFDILNKKTLTGMFLGTDPCPQSYGLDLLQCGASNDDHTQCCIENGVDQTSAGKKCLGFCNMKPGVTFQADVSMLPCWGVLNDIKDCFKQHIEEKLL